MFKTDHGCQVCCCDVCCCDFENADDDSVLNVDEEIRQLTSCEGNQRAQGCEALRRKDLLDYFRSFQRKCKRQESGDDDIDNCCSSCKDVVNEPERRKPVGNRITTTKLRRSKTFLKYPIGSPTRSVCKPKPEYSSCFSSHETCDTPRASKDSCSKSCEPKMFPHVQLSNRKPSGNRSPKFSKKFLRFSPNECKCPCCGFVNRSKVRKDHLGRDSVDCPGVAEVESLEPIWSDTILDRSSRTASPISSCCDTNDKPRFDSSKTKPQSLYESARNLQFSCGKCLEESSTDLKSIDVEVIEASSEEKANVECDPSTYPQPLASFQKSYNKYKTCAGVPKPSHVNVDACSNSNETSDSKTKNFRGSEPRVFRRRKRRTVPCRVETSDEDEFSPDYVKNSLNHHKKDAVSRYSMRRRQGLRGDDDLNSLEILCCEEILKNKAERSAGHDYLRRSDQKPKIKQLFPRKSKRFSKICCQPSKTLSVSRIFGSKNSYKKREENTTPCDSLCGESSSSPGRRFKGHDLSPPRRRSNEPKQRMPHQPRKCQANSIAEETCWPQVSKNRKTGIKNGFRRRLKPDLQISTSEVASNGLAVSRRFKNGSPGCEAEKKSHKVVTGPKPRGTVCKTQESFTEKERIDGCSYVEESEADADDCGCCQCPEKCLPEVCSCSACWETSISGQGCECCSCPETERNERIERRDLPIVLSALQFGKFRDECERIKECMNNSLDQFCICSSTTTAQPDRRNTEKTCCATIGNTATRCNTAKNGEKTLRIPSTDPCGSVETSPKECMRLNDLCPDISPASNWKKCGQRIGRVTEEYKNLTSCVRSLQRDAQQSSPQTCARKRITRRYPTGKEFTFEVKRPAVNPKKQLRPSCVLPKNDLPTERCDCQEPLHEIPARRAEPVPSPYLCKEKPRRKKECSVPPSQRSPLFLNESIDICQKKEPSSCCFSKICPPIQGSSCREKTRRENDRSIAPDLNESIDICQKMKPSSNCIPKSCSTRCPETRSSIKCPEPMSAECPCLCACGNCPSILECGGKSFSPTSGCIGKHSRMIKPKAKCNSTRVASPCTCQAAKGKKSGKPKMKKLLIFPPDEESGPPLTLYKNSSNVNCRVKGDAHTGFCYNVTYTQRFVSSTWCPKESARCSPDPKYSSKDCQCCLDHG